MEASVDQRLVVRKITDAHANYSVHGENETGLFSLQLILDDGAMEHLVLPDAKAMKVLIKLLKASDSAYFDLERRIITFGRVDFD
jgi:hypothetical protein